MTNNEKFNKLIIHPSFKKTIEEINRINIKLPPQATPTEWNLQFWGFPPSGKLVAIDEGNSVIDLDPMTGEKFYQDLNAILAYDESINQYKSLQGTAFLFSHSLIIHNENDYLPITLIKFYFYTRSETLVNKSQDCENIKYSNEIESDSKKDYINDRFEFLINHVPSNSVLLIDGPLVGGQVTHQTIELNKSLSSKKVLPIFFVKNSSSNLVTDNVKELKNRYNSDMHWAYTTLKQGQRTNFFKYEDQKSKEKSKIFCYLKSFDVSPQRIEFHVDTFKKNKSKINNLMDMIHYLILMQGEPKNPQVRSIAIAEMFARETIKFINIRDIMRQSGLTPTMNMERFGV